MSRISLKALIETPFLIFMTINPIIFDLRHGRASSRWLFSAGPPSHLIIEESSAAERAPVHPQRQEHQKVR